MKDKTLKQVQDEAKKLGHCLCNIALKCPCPAFINSKKCRCYEVSKNIKKTEL